MYWFDGDDGVFIILILYGFEGLVVLYNVVGFVDVVCEMFGWFVVVMEYCLCGGEFNWVCCMYYLGEMSDFELMVYELYCCGVCDFYFFGILFGGNVFGKWLGEQLEQMLEWICGVVVLLLLFDLLFSGLVIDCVVFGFYIKCFL